MPLLTERPPKGIEKLLDAAVSELVGHGALAVGTRTRPAVTMPIRVYNLGADAVATGRGLDAAQPTGWLSTLSADGEVRGTIELAPSKPTRRTTAATGELRFRAFTTGPLQRALAVAVETARKSAGRSELQIAVLRIPALYLLALWLSGPGGHRLVPVAPCPPSLKAGEPYPADRALAALRADAKRVLEADDASN